MSFDPSKKLVIDVREGKLTIECPFWANDLLNGIPSKRWNKSKRTWDVGMVRQNVEAVERLTQLAGTITTPDARLALSSYARQASQRRDVGVGFPGWYKFKREPRKHQRKALEKGYPLHSLAVHMEMQTGKTKTVIDLAAAHRMENMTDHVLVITKRTLRRNWLDEFDKDCPIPWDALLPETGKKVSFDSFMRAKLDFKIMIVGWESLSEGGLHEMVAEFLRTCRRPTIIGDETTYITNHKSIRTTRCLNFGKIARDSRGYVYSLAGAPALEGPMNLFTQFGFMDPDIVGIDDFLAFRNRYAVMGGYMREMSNGKKVPTEIVGYQNLDELMKLIAPYTFQFLKKDGYDMPPKRYQKRTVELTPAQRKAYDAVKKEGVLRLQGHPEQVIENVLGVMLRLHQITGGYGVKGTETVRKSKDGTEKMKIVYEPVEIVSPDKNPKMIEVVEFVEEAVRGKAQSLLWAVYMPEIQGLIWHMERMGLRVGQLHGGIPDPERQPIVRAFNKGDYDIIVGNAATGGMGFPLHAATFNMFYNNTHKAIDRVQAEDRNWEAGRKESPVIVDFEADRTIDRTILAALAEKVDLSEYVRHRIAEVSKLLDGEI